MPKYIFGDAKLDIGGVGPEQVAAKVNELSGGVRAVKAIEVSQGLNVCEQTVATLLAQAETLGLVRRVDAWRWLPTEITGDAIT
jgi:hypothetical protein